MDPAAIVTFSLWILLISSIVVILYRKSTRQFHVFREMGIPGPTPWPLIGTAWGLLFTEGFTLFDTNVYNRYGKPPLVGTFQQGSPALIVYDAEMLKQIMVKDFGSFINRNPVSMAEYPFRKGVQLLRDAHWKYVRSRMSPAFSVSKLRRMVGLINRCGANMIENMRAKSGENLNCFGYAQSYAMDVVASVAFGLDVDSGKDKNNIFVTNVAKLFKLSPWNPNLLAIFLMPSAVPYLVKLGFPLFNKERAGFFVDIVERALQSREDNPNEVSPDFLQLMISAKDENPEREYVPGETHKGLSKEEILAQSMLFFSAGFSTMSSALSITMYLLALHPEIQEKAYQEVASVLNGKDPDYDNTKEMSYLQMCIDESMRIYPPAARVDRICNGDLDIKGLTIPKDMMVIIPIRALHNDPDAWPEPERFDPDRFLPDAKAARHPCQYLPFGAGPRFCVAQRLAMLEVKMAMARVILNFKLSPCSKTEVPLTFLKLQTVASPVNGVWINAEARQ